MHFEIAGKMCMFKEGCQEYTSRRVSNKYRESFMSPFHLKSSSSDLVRKALDIVDFELDRGVIGFDIGKEYEFRSNSKSRRLSQRI